MGGLYRPLGSKYIWRGRRRTGGALVRRLPGQGASFTVRWRTSCNLGHLFFWSTPMNTKIYVALVAAALALTACKNETATAQNEAAEAAAASEQAADAAANAAAESTEAAAAAKALGLGFGDAYTPQLWVDENAIRHQAVFNARLAVVQYVLGNYAVIIKGNLRKLRATVNFADGIYVLFVGA